MSGRGLLDFFRGKPLGHAFVRGPFFVWDRFGVPHGFEDVDAVLEPFVDSAHFHGHADDLGDSLDEIDLVHSEVPPVGGVNPQAAENIVSDNDVIGISRT